MRHSRALLLLIMLSACSVGFAEDLPAGRHGVLLDLHGHNHAGSVVVALAPLVHWLGATVTDVDGWTTISRGDCVVYLQLPADRSQGFGAMVRLRDVAEPLGGELHYRAWDSLEGAKLGHIAHVEMMDGDRVARVLLHAAPPDAVSAILADVDRGDRCVAFLLQVSAVAGDFAKTHEPQWRDESGFGESYITGVLRRVEGHWQYAMRSSKVSHTPEEFAESGIPVEAARALGMEVEG